MRHPTRSAVVDRRSAGVDSRTELAAGLLARPARVAPKHLYDATGCALYAAICLTPEYYPTRTEAAIFADHGDDIASRIPRGGTLVDLGAGDGRKAEAWIARLAASAYLAVDYADDEIARTVRRMRETFPGLDARGVAADFDGGLDLADDLPSGPATFFYPGSSIGNCAPAEAVALLRAIRAHGSARRPLGLLVGVDTHKDRRRLEAAYDDALGVTAAFNRNVLRCVNAMLGTAFDVGSFRHVAVYDAAARRVEMHLEAVREQTVTIDGITRRFAEGERIHTENSYKYEPQVFERMLREAGFTSIACWTDRGRDFAVFHAA
jgi:dimethylhistidine N-methyltransferase